MPPNPNGFPDEYAGWSGFSRGKLLTWPALGPPVVEPPAPAQPFAELPKVLELAALKNVAIKISGACTLSHEPYPYKDIWDPLFRIFDAFFHFHQKCDGLFAIDRAVIVAQREEHHRPHFDFAVNR